MGEQHSKCAQEAHDAYQSASETAISELPATHPVRLGLALNFAVFYYEVFSSPVPRHSIHRYRGL